jgi:hypothetical protein
MNPHQSAHFLPQPVRINNSVCLGAMACSLVPDLKTFFLTPYKKIEKPG